jgi:hypothetical protein
LVGGFPAGVRLVGGAWLPEDVRDAAHGPAVSVGTVFGLHELGEPDHEPASRFASARAASIALACFPQPAEVVHACGEVRLDGGICSHGFRFVRGHSSADRSQLQTDCSGNYQ